MITMAIIGILSAIMFTGLAQEKSRTALKHSADQLATDLQGLQNDVQSGVVSPGGTTPPYGFGLEVSTATKTQYILFADMPVGSPPMGNLKWDGAGTDVLKITRNLPAKVEVTVLKKSISGGSSLADRLDIVFSGFKADANINPNSGCTSPAACADNASIILKDTSLNLCYAVTVNRVGGVVTKRQFSSSCT